MWQYHGRSLFVLVKGFLLSGDHGIPLLWIMVVFIPLENHNVYSILLAVKGSWVSVLGYLDLAHPTAKIHSLGNQDVSPFCLSCWAPLSLAGFGGGFLGHVLLLLKLCVLSSYLGLHPEVSYRAQSYRTLIMPCPKRAWINKENITRVSFKWLKSLKLYFVVFFFFFILLKIFSIYLTKREREGVHSNGRGWQRDK